MTSFRSDNKGDELRPMTGTQLIQHSHEPSKDTQRNFTHSLIPRVPDSLQFSAPFPIKFIYLNGVLYTEERTV